ncbi:MAG: hypothetical protein AAF268_16065, partial [Cyanobacteria bacterium P01_A01_bin.3]
SAIRSYNGRPLAKRNILSAKCRLTIACTGMRLLAKFAIESRTSASGDAWSYAPSEAKLIPDLCSETRGKIDEALAKELSCEGFLGRDDYARLCPFNFFW